MKQGIFISFEGNDGAGKTTVVNKLSRWLEEKGYPVVVTREPGGTVIGEKIRQVLLDPSCSEMDPKTEALLYAAARRQHVQELILPALKEGKIVLSDRFLDSTLAYQGVGRKLGLEAIETLNDFGLEGFRPDLTLFYALPLEEAQKRVQNRGDLNRLDAESQAFHQLVSDGFEMLIDREPHRFEVIDASASPEEVFQKTLEVLERRFR